MTGYFHIFLLLLILKIVKPEDISSNVTLLCLYQLKAQLFSISSILPMTHVYFSPISTKI